MGRGREQFVPERNATIHKHEDNASKASDSRFGSFITEQDRGSN